MLDFVWLFVPIFHTTLTRFISGSVSSGNGLGVSAQAITSVASPLVDFQVAQPPPLPKDAQQCTIPLLRYVVLIYDH